jgi:hypothetical protein
MELLQYTGAAHRRPVRRPTEAMRARSDAASPDLADFDLAEGLSGGVSTLVVALCYEHHLQLHGMLAVFAEQRGDDPEDALSAL